MGEQTEFEPGDKAPNDGIYMEVGEARRASTPRFRIRSRFA